MRPTHVSKKHRHRGGVVLVWVVISIAALIAFAGLVTDTSYVLLTGHQLQNAADAAAIACASNISSGTSAAASSAVSVAAANKAGGTSVQLSSGSDIVFGNYSRTTKVFSAGASPTNACQVTARRTTGSLGGPLSLMFGPIIGIKTSNVSRQSVAMTDDLAAGVIVLDPTKSSALTLASNVNVNNGSILVNSSSSTAVGWSGHPSIGCNAIRTVGNCSNLATSGLCSSNKVHVSCASVPDPLSSLTGCSKGTTQTVIKSPRQPGYYPNGLPAGTLLPGNYYVDNGINIGNGEHLDASAGCHIYLHTGGINVTGTGGMSCNPPTSGAYKDICIHQDRNNSSPCNLKQGGSASATCKGTIYAPSAAVTCSTGTRSCTASQVICKTLTCNGQLDVDHTGSFAISQHKAMLCK